MNRAVQLAAVVVAMLVPGAGLASPYHSQSFSFISGETTLVGLLDTPAEKQARATVIIVHGYGATDVQKPWAYAAHRRMFAELGLNVLLWDKPGCGDSEGTFDIDQPVASSAKEVVAAAARLRQTDVAGVGTIGIWGVSRAGWIAPMAIDEDPSLAFWISVSGPDDQENFRYLLEQNLPLEGRTPEETQVLVAQWQRAFNLLWQGGSYAEYIRVTPTLYEDPFLQYMGASLADEAAFEAAQAQFERGEFQVNEATGLMVYVPEFPAMLSRVSVPVLAIFGEKDTNVDWRKTLALYEETIGRNPDAELTVARFPGADHNLKPSTTGGVREVISQGNAAPIDGYFETIARWLDSHGFTGR